MEKKPQTAPVTENKMGVMPVGRLLVSMSVPMMISMLVQALYNIVDSIFVAQISENALSAVSLAFPLQTLMIAVAGGTGVGVNALVSRALGAKDQDTADRTANTGILLAVCSYVVFAILGALLVGPFFRFQTDVAEIVTFGIDYGHICVCASLGIFVQITMERLLQSTGRAKLSMVTQLSGAITNLILDPILIFGWFGLPAMGVAGAALATVIGQWLAASIGLFLNFKRNPEIHISLKKMRFHGPTIKAIYHIGIPSILMQCVGSVMVFLFNRILLSFTTTATAVFGAYFKLQSFIFMPIFGLNSGMVPIVSYNFGARKPDRLKRTIKLSVVTAIAIMAVGTAAFELIPATLLGMFNPSEEMLAIGVPALRIIATHFILAGFCIPVISVCQAIGNPFYSLICSVCRQIVVLLPAAFLLAQTGNLNLVWLAFPIAELMSLLMATIFLRKTMRRADRIMAGDPSM
ncbi:MAG: MATE family efflux transporter [Ruminiclostridium sp.]|nr:MATE family efflux transporter [Ruminiclostridium sp.]